ncbi:DoxX family protein [Caulobacter mirabilis]|uniref:DoxX family protein n=1 Tax=Caulobacter mirabilis TaxID=69666 RepID=A0A2D2AYC1_9CAUL|nr:DoxX family protein [Caulobacter mirabilis]ATQ43020.1 DoxX family protein [Caulobacter mirabilis]
MRDFLFLPSLARHQDASILALRLVTGGFLIWGVWDNVTSPADMAKFVAFLTSHKFPAPELLAPLSVYTQLAAGVGMILGLFTRWAGILAALNMLVAIAMVDRFGGIRGMWPAGALVLIGLYFAAHGAGRFSLDGALEGATGAKGRNRR